MKQKYRIFKDLQRQSGFGWNLVTNTIVADASVWDAYLEKHKNAAEFRKG